MSSTDDSPGVDNGQCPLCQQQFPVSQLNKHANQCLNISESVENEPTESETVKTRTRRSSLTKDNGDITATESGSGESWFARKRKAMSLTSPTSSESIDTSQFSNPNKRRLQTQIKDSKLKSLTTPLGFKTVEQPLNKRGKDTNKSDVIDSQRHNDGDATREVVVLCEKLKVRHKSDMKIHIDSPNDIVESVMPSISITDLMLPAKNVNTRTEFGKKPQASGSVKSTFAPLAERMRPQTFNDYIGQEQAVGPKCILRSLLESDKVPSMILWGPPGCGKTTLAKIIAHSCKSRGSSKFVQLSATTSGVGEVRDAIKVARNDQSLFRKKTVLFIDEIHRFNKAQQDTLLPHVEDGTVILIGATTENPSFQVNSALLSRCRVIVLDKLSSESIESILYRALAALSIKIQSKDTDDTAETEASDKSDQIFIQKEAITTLAKLCDGDARVALNGLQMAVQSVMSSAARKDATSNIVTADQVKEGLQRSHVLYDRAGEEHYNIISAMHKAIRGSDDSAALYWLARMLEGGENPLYVARRLVRIAGEDIGLADSQALPQAVSAYQACHFLGMPECDVLLAQCVVYMARAPKSVDVYKAYGLAKACVKEHEGGLPSVPLHLRNASTRLMKELGYGKDYKYNPDFDGPVDQEYFPKCLKGTNFFK